MRCWWMKERSLEWTLLTLRTVLSGEDVLEEDLSSKPNPRLNKMGFKMDMMMIFLLTCMSMIVTLKYLPDLKTLLSNKMQTK